MIKRDKNAQLRFAPLQSEIAEAALAGKQHLRQDMSSFVFLENEVVYTRSTAALRVCRYLKGGWPLMYAFMIVPRFIRDAVYDYIARNRYRWFGKREACMIPTPDVRSRFLTEPE